ncbi:MAG: 2-C-methyl-D-erythritol 4-phosphate cytidylyltransferase [Candidatus Omnitrophica bacterium]|nr:2-C-methyl-D-erythritol 4-phosphate cytidylyltransferase [Candidatus Omnitrophota bacterium]
MFVSAIVLAAGQGKRFKCRTSKPLVRIGNNSIIKYSLKTLSEIPYVKSIIVVGNRYNLKGVLREVKDFKKVREVVLGGKERQDSVMNGLKSVENNADLILIHDAARPFVSKTDVCLVIKEAKKTGAAILGVPVKATIKEGTRHKVQGRSKDVVKKTLDRSCLWEIHTPQVFKKEIILEAFKKYARLPVTDDSMLVEKLGKKVSLVKGSYNNIKITTPEDRRIAKAICHLG